MNQRTSWTTIRGATDGDAESRQRFAKTYEPVVRAYLDTRLISNKLRASIDDAVQDVFWECFRADGILERVNDISPASFRAFLFGVIKNVARRYESNQNPQSLEREVEADDTSASCAFDRKYAVALMQEASFVQAAMAKQKGAEAERRVELLQLRFGESLPIREIASRWNVDPAWLHHQYAAARNEFHEALRFVVGQHDASLTSGEIDDHCRSLLSALSKDGNC